MQDINIFTIEPDVFHDRFYCEDIDVFHDRFYCEDIDVSLMST